MITFLVIVTDLDLCIRRFVSIQRFCADEVLFYQSPYSVIDTKQLRSVLIAFFCSLVRLLLFAKFFKYKFASSNDAAFSGTIRFMTRIQFCLFESNCCSRMHSKSIKSSIVANLIRWDIVMQSYWKERRKKRNWLEILLLELFFLRYYYNWMVTNLIE